MTTAEIVFDCFKKSSGVNTDTRSIQPGQLYFALKGPSFNGNHFAKNAIEAGAIAAVVDEPIPETSEGNPAYILVEDALKALQTLARNYRDTFDIPFLAIGGSNGKTTTKELVARVLATKFKVFATPGNLNNHIGVPLTLLRMPVDTNFAVIEMGANHKGEIEELCAIANPNFGLLTNIGKDHLEGFGSVEGVAAANSELYYHLLKNKGIAFVNTREEHLKRMASRLPSYISYPDSQDFCPSRLISSDFQLVYQDYENNQIQTQLVGHYNFANIATALCVSKYFQIPAKDANEAIASYVPGNNRSQVIQTEKNTIISDAYNANPSSMHLALDNFAHLKASDKIVMLGDMLELGKESQAEHALLGEKLSTLDFSEIWLIGLEMRSAAQSCPKALYFEQRSQAEALLQQKELKGKTILLKGSRGLALERLTAHL